ncbi:MAG TPA: hypothetical protein VFH91_08110 [Pyrinomonadaceae bacterium]|nr:hypothetical protein [Pyrinomonadaceae bacterium]
MPKDNENIPPIFLGPMAPSEPQGFKLEEMVTCEECLRANAPTRVACMYCGQPLPVNEATARLRRPTLKAPERNQPGFNSIIIPQQSVLAEREFAQVAKLLRLDEAALQQIIDANLPLPLARTSTAEESVLVSERLAELGVRAASIGDPELGLTEPHLKVRALTFQNDALSFHQAGRADVSEVLLSDVMLIVAARIVRSQIEIRERKTRKTEGEIVDSSQFYADELMIDLYSAKDPRAWRIASNSFDFSCLGEYKTLVAGENLNRLTELLRTRMPNAQLDHSYDKLRSILEHVWPSQVETTSTGWKRERPGKYVVGAATSNSNEEQFTRYSRLRSYLVLKPLT